MNDSILETVRALRDLGAVEIELEGLKVRFEAVQPPVSYSDVDAPISEEEREREFNRIMYMSGSGGF